MRHKEFRPRTAVRTSFRPAPSRRGPVPRTRHRARGAAAITAVVLAVVVVAAIVYGAVQALRPVPALAMTASPPPMRTLPGTPPAPAWPAQGQAAIGMTGAGLLGTHGGSQPLPIASLTKIMTAYLVLRDHPLPSGGSGPAITVSPADVATYNTDASQGESVVKVTAGERLTELQALEAMLIPSGNNIATLLARWDAGSLTSFVAKMNDAARSLGLRSTHYADASGADPATVSTAADQYRLTLRALQIPAFRQIVAMPQVTLPVAGTAYNVNAALGHDGIVGVKTGSSQQAGGCLAFAASGSEAGSQAMIVGVVLGVPPTARQPSELAGVIAASERLLTSVRAAPEHVEVVRPGTVLGRVHSAWTTGPAAVAATGVSVTGWPGTPVTVAVTPLHLADHVASGQTVAHAAVTVGDTVRQIPVIADGAVRPPPLRWRLTRR
jgi:D-alanyl-D-alanine carboxypeptidase (penicillin-binding protein 5/6)